MTTPVPQYQVDVNEVINSLTATPEGKVQWELAQLRAIAQRQFHELEEHKSQIENHKAHIEKLQSAISESEPTV